MEKEDATKALRELEGDNQERFDQARTMINEMTSSSLKTPEDRKYLKTLQTTMRLDALQVGLDPDSEEFKRTWLLVLRYFGILIKAGESNPNELRLFSALATLIAEI